MGATATGGHGTLTWLTADNQDSAQLAISATDGSHTRQNYLPFGGQRGSQGPPAGSQNGYLNQPYDPTTGLIQDGARLYDPTLARFISPDPLVDPTSPQDLNAYTYADNNPESASDPSGLRLTWDFEEGAGTPEFAPGPPAVPSTIGNSGSPRTTDDPGGGSAGNPLGGQSGSDGGNDLTAQYKATVEGVADYWDSNFTVRFNGNVLVMELDVVAEDGTITPKTVVLLSSKLSNADITTLKSYLPAGVEIVQAAKNSGRLGEGHSEGVTSEQLSTKLGGFVDGVRAWASTVKVCGPQCAEDLTDLTGQQVLPRQAGLDLNGPVGLNPDGTEAVVGSGGTSVIRAQSNSLNEATEDSSTTTDTDPTGLDPADGGMDLIGPLGFVAAILDAWRGSQTSGSGYCRLCA